MSEKEPGRELDALIAKRVMGLWVHHYDKDYSENCSYVLMRRDSVLPFVDPFIAGGGFRANTRKTEAKAWADVPCYSTDSAAAAAIDAEMATRDEATQDRYIVALIRRALGDDAARRHETRGLYSDQILALMVAAPVDKARAALDAVRAE